MPRTEKPVRVERGLYRAGRVYLACATPPGSRTPRWKTLGEVGLMEARVRRDAWVVQVKAGRAPKIDKHAVSDVGQRWLAHVQKRVDTEDLRERTQESYETGFRLHIEPQYGPRQIRSVTVEDLVVWLRAQRELGAARASIRARWMAWRGLMAYAVRKGYRDTNPTDELLSEERPKPGDPSLRYLSRDEVSLLIESAGDDRALIATGLFTGLRASEILGLTWRDIDFAASEIHAHFQMSRKGKRVPLKTAAGKRDVILMGALAKVLRRHRLSQLKTTDHDLVFQSGTGATMGYWSLQGRFDRARNAAKLEDVTPHAMRHTFASILISEGRTVEFVRRQLGHARTSTTLDVYSHLFDAQRHAKEARDGLDSNFGALLGTKRGLSA